MSTSSQGALSSSGRSGLQALGQRVSGSYVVCKPVLTCTEQVPQEQSIVSDKIRKLAVRVLDTVFDLRIDEIQVGR